MAYTSRQLRLADEAYRLRQVHEEMVSRGTVILAVVESIVTGFFLGTTLIECLQRGGLWTWAWPLVMAFASGVGAIQATLIALHNCSPVAKVEE